MNSKEQPGNSEPVSTQSENTLDQSLNSAGYSPDYPTYIPPAQLNRGKINPKTFTPSQILNLQRIIGNRAVARLLASHSPPKKGSDQEHLPPQLQNRMETAFGADLSSV